MTTDETTRRAYYAELWGAANQRARDAADAIHDAVEMDVRVLTRHLSWQFGYVREMALDEVVATADRWIAQREHDRDDEARAREESVALELRWQRDAARADAADPLDPHALDEREV